jgi:hypothetical protein
VMDGTAGRFIDEHKDRGSPGRGWGIEPIAEILDIATSTYHAAKRGLHRHGRSVAPNWSRRSPGATPDDQAVRWFVRSKPLGWSNNVQARAEETR